MRDYKSILNSSDNEHIEYVESIFKAIKTMMYKNDKSTDEVIYNYWALNLKPIWTSRKVNHLQYLLIAKEMITQYKQYYSCM
jgi:hypothetical protein